MFGFHKRNAQERVDQAEAWSGYATLLILVGIIAEIGVLFMFPHNGVSSQEQWSLVGANAAIGIGLAIEFACILRSIKANRELKVESDALTAAAMDRAARAETELVEFRRPRRALMTAENKAKLVKRLSSFAGAEFDTGLGSGGEQMHFLWDLEEVLAAAKWKQLDWAAHVVGNHMTRSQRPLAGFVAAENVEIQLDPTCATRGCQQLRLSLMD
jgi:hypothetical protein